MTWTIRPGHNGVPFSRISDFEKHAQSALVRPFENYNPELTMTLVEDFLPSMATMELVWDVDLDGVKGGYHEPMDHANHAAHHLLDGIRLFATRLKVDIKRFPTENDVDGATDLVAWDEGYRDRSYAAFKAKMDEDFPPNHA
jgi:hypothetical protein